MKKIIFIKIISINLIFVSINCMMPSSSTFSNNIEISIRQVCVPFTNLQKKPTKNNFKQEYPVLSTDSPDIESQLLFGEYLFFENKKQKIDQEKWIFVYCLEQFDANLTPLTGWIKKKDSIRISDCNYDIYDSIKKDNFITTTKPWSQISLINRDFLIDIPIGTKLDFISVSTKNFLPVMFTTTAVGKKAYIYSQNIMQHLKKPFKSIPKIANIRKNIKKIASEFLEMPYAWGGRTPYCENSYYQTSIDCSGFVNLLYRSCGLAIPRNSEELYKFCNKLSLGKELETGDFVFLADTKTKKINHVLLFLKNQKLQESIGSEKPYANRIIDFNTRFGKNKENIKSGDVIGKKIIYFGSVLNNQEKIKQINELFLNCELILVNKDNVKIND